MNGRAADELDPVVTSPKKVAVIGAGLAGAATAYALSRAGVEVTVYEARLGPALETSFANGGMLTPSMPDPWNGPGVWRHLAVSLFNPSSSMLLRPAAIPSLATWGLSFLRHSTPARFAAATRANFMLCNFSTQETRRWRDRETFSFDDRDAPTLKFFRSAEALRGPLDIARSLQPLGLEFEILDAGQTLAAEPALSPVADQIHAGIRYPDDMRGDAHQFTTAVSARARALGATFLFDAPVDRIESRGGRVAGVVSHEQVREHDAVIVASAIASRGIVAAFGLKLPVRPAKGYSITFDLGELVGGPQVAVVDDAMHAAVVPLGNRLRVVGTAEFAGEDRRLDATRIDNLMRLLHAVYPEIACQLRTRDGVPWTGLRPMSADGCPYIGETRIPGLWLNTGHGHLGWTMAAGSAALITALLTGNAPPIEPSPYAASRLR